MPKIPKKKTTLAQRLQKEKCISLEQVAKKLLKVDKLLKRAQKEVDDLWVDLYVKGVESHGPLHNEDDIPF